MDASVPSRRSFARRWLLPLLAAGAVAGLVWWLAGPTAPRCVQTFPTDLHLAGVSADGERAWLRQTHRPHRCVERHLRTGVEVEIPLPSLVDDAVVRAVGPSLLWVLAREIRLDASGRATAAVHQGPYVAYDLATRRWLPGSCVLGMNQWTFGSNFGDRLVAAWRENWLAPCLRFQIHDPRTGLKVDRLLPMAPDFLYSWSLAPSLDGRWIALRLFNRRGPRGAMTFRTDTLIVDALIGAPQALLPNFSLSEQGWSADGEELAGTSHRSPSDEVWLERWRWQTKTKLCERFLQRQAMGERLTHSLNAKAWLPSTGEWLLESNQRDLFADHTWYANLRRDWGSPVEPNGKSSLWQLHEASGAMRRITGRIRPHSNPQLVFAGEAVLVHQVGERNTEDGVYAIYTLAGSYGLPWPFRLPMAVLAGLGIFLTLPRLLGHIAVSPERRASAP